MKNKNRFLELDGLRGIAALAVVLLHYTSTINDIFPQQAPFPYPFIYGGLGVQLFFLISGFVILMTAQRRTQPGAFLKARFIRLYPTYWVCLTLTVLIIYGLPFPRLQRPLWEVAVNYSMLQSFVAVRDFDGAYWSLARELVFYFLIASALWILKGKLNDKFISIFSLAWSLAGLALIFLYKLTEKSLFNILVSASVAQYAALFSLGMVLYIKRDSGHLLPVYYPLLPIAVIAEGLMSNWTNAAILLVIILLFSLVVSRPSVKFLRAPWLVWLGSVSYPLYLLHQNIGYALITSTSDALGIWGSRFFTLALVLFMAWAVHELVEVRLTRSINRRSRTRHSAQ